MVGGGTSACPGVKRNRLACHRYAGSCTLSVGSSPLTFLLEVSAFLWRLTHVKGQPPTSPLTHLWLWFSGKTTVWFIPDEVASPHPNNLTVRRPGRCDRLVSGARPWLLRVQGCPPQGCVPYRGHTGHEARVTMGQHPWHGPCTFGLVLFRIVPF